MDGPTKEIQKEVKGFKRESLKKTETVVRDRKPSQAGKCFKRHVISKNCQSSHLDIKTTVNILEHQDLQKTVVGRPQYFDSPNVDFLI